MKQNKLNPSRIVNDRFNCINLINFLNQFYVQYEIVICANMLEPWEKRFIDCLFIITFLIVTVIFYKVAFYVATVLDLIGSGTIYDALSKVTFEKFTMSKEVFTTKV